jgi:hypothetical protein
MRHQRSRRKPPVAWSASGAEDRAIPSSSPTAWAGGRLAAKKKRAFHSTTSYQSESETMNVRAVEPPPSFVPRILIPPWDIRCWPRNSSAARRRPGHCRRRGATPAAHPQDRTTRLPRQRRKDSTPIKISSVVGLPLIPWKGFSCALFICCLAT